MNEKENPRAVKHSSGGKTSESIIHRLVALQSLKILQIYLQTSGKIILDLTRLFCYNILR